MNFLLCLFLILPVGCGTSSDGIKDWVLHLELPRAFSHGARRRNLESRAIRLEVVVETPSGSIKEYYATSGHFEEIQLTDLEIDPEAGTYHFHAKLWDKTSDGTPRNTPALEGERQISTHDLNAADRVLIMKLKSNVSEREFD